MAKRNRTLRTSRTALQTTEFFVSPKGNDRWSGLLSEPNRDKTDGPFASLDCAQRATRSLKVKGVLPGLVRIVLRGGVYTLNKPFVLKPNDSGSPPLTDNWNNVTGGIRSVIYTSFPNERPVISGGRRITDWSRTKVNGRDAWVTSLPSVRRGEWTFTQLWVNGSRRKRPRTSTVQLKRIAEPLGDVVYEGDIHKVLFTGQDRFRFQPGDLEAWRNVEDIEFVGLHFWIESRIRFAGIDPATCTAKLAHRSKMRLTDDFSKLGAPYYVENVFEMLSEPGEWYLDRPTGKLYYLPMPGETMEETEVWAPYLPQLILIQGNTAKGQYVEHVCFENLTFSHTEWVPGPEALSATPQAACHIPGAVVLTHAKDIQFERCEFTHIGSYGVEIGGGSTDISVIRCSLTDLGGGGVKVWHTSPPTAKHAPGSGIDMAASTICRRITISDCEIADGGHRYHQAVGVLIGKATGVLVLHNHIHDFDYTGVSVGWTWGYAEGNAYGNIIERNHIHHIGRGMLSDMGGIYTLGMQPGTRIRFNVLHDVESRGYGGWGIYTDEGSSHILIESNITYRTKSQGFNQHYGKDNIVRNNIFALGREAIFSRSRIERHCSFEFVGNILYIDNDGKVLGGNWSTPQAVIDRNLYFNASGKPLDFAGATWKQWRERGLDAHSLVANPGFLCPAKGNFNLRRGSPASKIGFTPWDFGDIGPRHTPGPP